MHTVFSVCSVMYTLSPGSPISRIRAQTVSVCGESNGAESGFIYLKLQPDNNRDSI